MAVHDSAGGGISSSATSTASFGDAFRERQFRGGNKTIGGNGAISTLGIAIMLAAGLAALYFVRR